jgi:hypothetical protein
MTTLEMTPGTLNGLSMSSCLGVNKVLGMIDCIVGVKFRKLIYSSIRSPHVTYDDRTGEDVLLDEREKSVRVSSLHRVKKTSTAASLHATKKPLLIRNKAPTVILPLADHGLVDFNHNAWASDLDRVLSVVKKANLSIKLHPVNDSVPIRLGPIFSLHVEYNALVCLFLAAEVEAQSEDIFERQVGTFKPGAR